VIDGYHTTILREESLAMPEIDIVTTHHYPALGKSFAKAIRENAARAKGRKPYFVGEFGFVDLDAMKATLDAVRETGASGALLWSLRPRNRDGRLLLALRTARRRQIQGLPLARLQDGRDLRRNPADEADAGASVRHPRACPFRRSNVLCRRSCCQSSQPRQSPGKAP